MRTKGKATHKLSDVELQEISFVGKGDNPGAHILLLKRKKDSGIVTLGKEFKSDDQEQALKKWFDSAVGTSILKDAMTFDQIISNQEMKGKIWNLVYTLEDSISSIVNDSDATDKAALIQQSVDEFKAAITSIAKGEPEMSVELKKQLEDAQKEVETLKAANEALTTEVTALKAAPKPGEKCPTCGAMTTKKEADEIDKSALPEAVRKKLEDQDALIEKNRKETEVLKDNELTREYVSKAVEVATIGKSDEVGSVLKQIAKHDSELAGKVFELLKGADTKIRKGGLFKEAGEDNATETASAYDRIVAKAAELRKTCPELTPEKAFTKVYDTDAELRKQYIEETRR